jgi:hypothetical protein
MMLASLWRAALIGGAAVVIVVVGHANWKRGTPYQPAVWSPNGQYYVQKYSNLTLSKLWPVAPGHGSDSVDGYIRLYDKNGRMIHERFERFIRDVEPLWAGTRVYLRGVAAMDNDPWNLPSSAE